jgi:hypothetical protein
MTIALRAVLNAIESGAMWANDPDDRPNAGDIARRALGRSVLTPESYELERIIDRIMEYSRGVRLFMPREYRIDQ